MLKSGILCCFLSLLLINIVTCGKHIEDQAFNDLNDDGEKTLPAKLSNNSSEVLPTTSNFTGSTEASEVAKKSPKEANHKFADLQEHEFPGDDGRNSTQLQELRNTLEKLIEDFPTKRDLNGLGEVLEAATKTLGNSSMEMRNLIDKFDSLADQKSIAGISTDIQAQFNGIGKYIQVLLANQTNLAAAIQRLETNLQRQSNKSENNSVFFETKITEAVRQLFAKIEFEMKNYTEVVNSSLDELRSEILSKFKLDEEKSAEIKQAIETYNNSIQANFKELTGKVQKEAMLTTLNLTNSFSALQTILVQYDTRMRDLVGRIHSNVSENRQLLEKMRSELEESLKDELVTKFEEKLEESKQDIITAFVNISAASPIESTEKPNMWQKMENLDFSFVILVCIFLSQLITLVVIAVCGCKLNQRPAAPVDQAIPMSPLSNRSFRLNRSE
ncbi:Hypothetical predicted protein [Cloeon dipterum]|uniref:Uncharacterized protein n=1 Tax=Cloeon dipterum TaxID=197152 RepID=A0A8S1BXG1_9INSE|nr:Hypothetical predicted protein [Cloeon dipterum]